MTVAPSPPRADPRAPAPDRSAPWATVGTWLLARWTDLGSAPVGRRVLGSGYVFVLGCLVGACASFYTVHNGTNMDYGDSMSHLTIARRILDNKSPGLQQLGTVWLPLPHLLLMPLVQNDLLFRTGIAACILGTLCLGITAVSVYRICARLEINAFGRVASLVVLLANPSLLYACSTALTEPVLIAAITACIAGLAGWSQSRRRLSGGELAVFAGVPAAAGVLTRYEGWALVISGSIFVVIVVLRRGDGFKRAIVLAAAFATPPAIAAIWWLSYNLAWYRNPLEFLTGDYSAAAFTEVFIEQGQLTTKGNLGLSFQVFGWATMETAGLFQLVIAGLGLLALTWRLGITDHALIVWLAGTASAFLLFSLTTGQHIMVNDASLPMGAYNNRYVLSAVPWAALLVAVLLNHPRVRKSLGALAVVLVVGGVAAQNVYWAGDPGARMTIIGEANVNHGAFVPVKEAGQWLHDNYDGGGILMDESSESLAIAPVIGIPLHEYFNRSSGEYFEAALKDPWSNARWVVMHRHQTTNTATNASIDMVTDALAQNSQFLASYELLYEFGDLGIFRRIANSPPFVEAPGSRKESP